MCSPDSFVTQAISWLFDDITDIAKYNVPEHLLVLMVDDLVHLENQIRGVPGYDPDVIPRDYKLEF